jgi:deazaflavin-dependent oxidoreductase (nitroreductase family)
MAQTQSKPADVANFTDRIVRPLTRIFNPLIMRIAGRRWVPMYSPLHHRGHKSGRMYVTPVTAVPRGGWFWLGLAFGEDAGWARNVRAAGECVVRYRGTDYRLVEPVVFEGSAVKTELPPLLRFAMPLIGVRKVLRMRASTAG